MIMRAKRQAPLFKQGRVVMTQGFAEAISKSNLFVPLQALYRHLRGDWGDCCEEDKKANDEALRHGGRIFSVYHHQKIKFWVITEADRSATTLLLPEEY